MRVGQGIDVHRLEPGRPLILGGVNIPFNKGLAGHSDADVLTHAIMDALLGAAALGDIGTYFPDTEDSYRDANSLELLAETLQLVKSEGYELINVDVTLMLERPKLAPYISQMKANLAEVLRIKQDRVGIKATTWEKMGFIGEGAGVMAQAVALLNENRKTGNGIH